MISKLLPSLLIASLGPVSLGVPDPAPVMFFDVHRVPEIPEMIVRESTLQGVPSHLAITVAWRESKFNPLAVGTNRDGSHDWGVMQISDHTVKMLHVADALDVRQNTIAGIGVLSWGLGLCKSEAGALRYYAHGHCGNSKVERP